MPLLHETCQPASHPGLSPVSSSHFRRLQAPKHTLYMEINNLPLRFDAALRITQDRFRERTRGAVHAPLVW